MPEQTFADLLLLTTVGARSGAEHTVPLGYLRDGADLLVVGSAGGSDRHPDWYRNLLAHPLVRVEIGGSGAIDSYEAVAVPAEGQHRDTLFRRIVAEQPGYGDYQAGTTRELPVVSLQRSAPAMEPAALGNKLLEVHAWLRHQLARVQLEADEYFADRERQPHPGLGLQLRQHCLAFCDALHGHHEHEDAGLFPGLEHHRPDLADAIARLRAEHRVVAAIQASLLALLDGIRDADPAPFRAELARLTSEFTAHLDHEEATVLPILTML